MAERDPAVIYFLGAAISVVIAIVLAVIASDGYVPRKKAGVDPHAETRAHCAPPGEFCGRCGCVHQPTHY